MFALLPLPKTLTVAAFTQYPKNEHSGVAPAAGSLRDTQNRNIALNKRVLGGRF